jgi:PAS domain S-box-containing protein
VYSKRNVFLVGTIRLLLPVFLVFGMVFHGYGQKYLVHRYTGAEGLPDSVVYDIAQDHVGRMWFATRGGITRYDGAAWRKYTINDGLPPGPFYRLQTDRAGNIWALPKLHPGKLYLAFFGGSRWRVIPGPQAGSAGLDNAISFQLLEQNTEEPAMPVAAVGTVEHGLLLWQQGEWTHLDKSRGLPGNCVNGMAALEGKLYVATDQGLAVVTPSENGAFEIDTRINRRLALPAPQIQGVAVQDKAKFPVPQLEHSRVWLVGKLWLGYFEEHNEQLTLYLSPFKFDMEGGTVTAVPDYRCGLYVGRETGVHYFNIDTRRWRSLDVSNGLAGDGQHSVFVDVEKNVWIPSGRGVSKIASRRFANFHYQNGLLEDEVTAVQEYEPGKFILGHARGFTFMQDSRLKTLSLKGKIGANVLTCRVMDIKSGPAGNIWAALNNAGVVKIDRNLEITWFGHPHGLKPPITSLQFDPNGNLWVGGNNGLFFYTGSNFISIPCKRFPLHSVRRIYWPPGPGKQLLYCATSHAGIFVYEPEEKKWDNYRLPGRNIINNTYAVVKDSRGRILIGSLAGLYTADTRQRTLAPFKENGFPLQRPVYFITETPDRRLWFGTDRGVYYWDGSRSRHYSLRQGLAGQETNRAAGFADSRGRLWIGTDRGLSIYDPAFDNPPQWNPAPRLKLISIDADEQAIHLETAGHHIRLHSSLLTLTFKIRAISFQDEHSISLRYILEGHDREWQSVENTGLRTITYPSLPPGSYRFRLKARSVLGAWSDTVMSPQLIVPAPFYNRWWFYLILFLAAVFIVYSAARFIIQKRYAALLKKQVAERTGQLQAVEERYRTLFEESKDGVLVTTIHGKVMTINPACLEILGFQPGENPMDTGEPFSIYSDAGERDAFRKAIEKKGYVKDYESTLRRRDGELISVLVTATVMRDKDGNITGYRGILRDITEKKRLEQQLSQAQKMEAIGTLAGGIAHDFNNILGVIIGYTELIAEDLGQDHPLAHNVRQVLLAATRAADLVKQILAFSRQSKRERVPINIKITIEESLRMLRSSLPASIEIRSSIHSEQGLVLADPTQVHQVMMNLCANAAHAMRGNGGVLDIRLDEVYLDDEAVKKHHDIPTGNYIRLAVGDTGHGILKIVMKRIFEPYYTTKDTGEGTGMGLAVIHGIVKSHDGDITVYSEPGKGTTFNIFLPLVREEGDRKFADHAAHEIPTGTEHILLIDDEADLAQIGKQMLERLGYRVTCRSDAVEALETFRKQPRAFDLVITDLTMPRITGRQIAETVKQIRPGTPVILCSGFGAAVPREELESCIDDFVMKPVIKSELAKAVRHVLDNVS